MIPLFRDCFWLWFESIYPYAHFVKKITVLKFVLNWAWNAWIGLELQCEIVEIFSWIISNLLMNFKCRCPKTVTFDILFEIIPIGSSMGSVCRWEVNGSGCCWGWRWKSEGENIISRTGRFWRFTMECTISSRFDQMPKNE